MSRIRSIKPEAFRSRSLAQVEIPVRWFYAGLWTEADDLGAGIADADLLKGALFAKDPDVTAAVLEDWLNVLVASQHIILYEVDGGRYYQVIRWTQHQPPSSRRGTGKYPRPDEGTTWKSGDGADEVADILAARDLIRRQAGKAAPVGDEKAWLAEAARRRSASDGAQIQAIMNRSPAMSPNDVANEVEGIGTFIPGVGRIDGPPEQPEPADKATRTAKLSEARSATTKKRQAG